jgi:hypothetical protein
MTERKARAKAGSSPSALAQGQSDKVVGELATQRADSLREWQEEKQKPGFGVLVWLRIPLPEI